MHAAADISFPALCVCKLCNATTHDALQCSLLALHCVMLDMHRCNGASDLHVAAKPAVLDGFCIGFGVHPMQVTSFLSR